MTIFWRKHPWSHCKKLDSFWEVNLCPSEVTVSLLPQPHREDNLANTTTFLYLFECIFPNLRVQSNRSFSGGASQGTGNMILSMKQKSRQSIRRGMGRSQVMEVMACPLLMPLPTHTAQGVATNIWLVTTHNSLVPDENPSSCSKLGQNPVLYSMLLC